MIYATIFSSEMTPLTDAFEISQDAEFGKMETRAMELATHEAKCCIRWSRDDDSQVAYWSPRGATLKPYWYSKLGRPSEMRDGKRVNVYLDAASLSLAAELGAGNVSEGIRIALSKKIPPVII